jgi:hypothetical protein
MPQITQLLSIPSLLQVALTSKQRPYGSITHRLYNLRIMTIIAAKSGHAPIVSHLLSLAQSHNIINELFISHDIIHAAIDSDNVDVLCALIDVDPSCVNYDLEYGGYPLNQVIFRYEKAPENTLKAIASLLENGADPNAIYGPHRSYGALLSSACSKGHLEIARLLIRHGAVILDSGAIQAAVSKSQIEILELLLEHGADVNERPKLCLTLGPGEQEERRSETPLHVAVREGQVEAAKWLLEHGADAGLRDCWGRTAVDISITGNMVDIMDVFSSILPG